MKQKILYVCTIPALEAYSIGLIRAAFQSRELAVYCCIFLAASDERTNQRLYTIYGVPSNQEDQILFIRLPKNKIVRTLSGNRFLTRVAEYARAQQIKTIHFISQDIMLYGNLKLFSAFKIWYTVHDLVPHEARLSRLQQAKHYYFRIRKDSGLIHKIQNLVTNSHYQENALQSRYPGKQVRYHQMPGLVSPDIEEGNALAPELEGQNNYVLFFGRVELYKGLDQLYTLFSTDPELSKVQLVIAGRGEIYFERNVQREQNILFINRFIDDAEINALFRRAKLFVMPYRSATQSAVSSLAYHYQLPVIASDIDGLKETILHEQTGLLYPKGDSEALKQQILRMLNDQGFYEQMQQNIVINPFYDTERLIAELENLYKL